MSENDTQVKDHTEGDAQPTSMQDITRLFAEYDAKLTAAKAEYETADAMLEERREEHAAALGEAQREAKARIDALRAEEDKRIAEIRAQQTDERSELVEQVNGAMDNYRELIGEALGTGVITKQALALGGHTSPKGKRKA